MKPLYLEAASNTRVHLEDPALVVQRKDKADQLFPLDRIGRVHSHENVEWSHAALIAVAKRGIPLVFHDTEGRVVARLLGRTGEPGSLVQQLEELLSTPWGQDQYNDWCKHNEREILIRLKPQYGWMVGGSHLARQQSDVLKTLCVGMERDEAAISLRYIDNRVHGWLAQRLAALGIGATTPHLAGGVIDLAGDLSRILRWVLVADWVQFYRKYARSRLSTAQRVTQHFQQLEPSLEREGRRLLARLHLWTANPQ